MNIRIVRTGITRTVVLIGRYAVKVPSLRGGSTGARMASFCQGVLANQSERQWYDYEGWSGCVAPVLHSWLGGVVQVYPRCGSSGGRYAPDLDPSPGDRKADNCGVLNGRLVWVDYVM